MIRSDDEQGSTAGKERRRGRVDDEEGATSRLEGDNDEGGTTGKERQRGSSEEEDGAAKNEKVKKKKDENVARGRIVDHPGRLLSSTVYCVQEIRDELPPYLIGKQGLIGV